MRGGLFWLRLDQDLTIKADLVLVLDHEREEATELVHLVRQVGVEQRFIAFTAAPQHIVRAAERLGHIHTVLHGRGTPGKHIGIGIRCRASHEAGMREQVRRAPQQLGLVGLHLLGEVVSHLVEVLE